MGPESRRVSSQKKRMSNRFRPMSWQNCGDRIFRPSLACRNGGGTATILQPRRRSTRRKNTDMTGLAVIANKAAVQASETSTPPAASSAVPTAKGPRIPPEKPMKACSPCFCAGPNVKNGQDWLQNIASWKDVCISRNYEQRIRFGSAEPKDAKNSISGNNACREHPPEAAPTRFGSDPRPLIFAWVRNGRRGGHTLPSLSNFWHSALLIT